MQISLEDLKKEIRGAGVLVHSVGLSETPTPGNRVLPVNADGRYSRQGLASNMHRDDRRLSHPAGAEREGDRDMWRQLRRGALSI